jgi:hypothetical protein
MSAMGLRRSCLPGGQPVPGQPGVVNWYMEIDPNEPNPQGPVMNDAEAKTELVCLGAPGACPRSIRPTPAGSRRVGASGQHASHCRHRLVCGSCDGSRDRGQCGVLVRHHRHDGTSTGTVNIRDNGAGKDRRDRGWHDQPVRLQHRHGAFSVFAGANYLGATNVIELDGWFIFNQPGTQKFFTSPNYWDGTADFDGTYFALKDNSRTTLSRWFRTTAKSG